MRKIRILGILVVDIACIIVSFRELVFLNNVVGYGLSFLDVLGTFCGCLVGFVVSVVILLLILSYLFLGKLIAKSEKQNPD